MNQIIAIDPGASGGIAWMDEDGIAQAAPMPKTHSDIVETIVGKSFGNVTFVIEDVPLAAIAIGGIVGWAPVWYRSNGRLSRQEAAQRLTTLVLNLVRARKSKARRKQKEAA